MNHHFSDIISRIAEPPAWWDRNGTPRYGPFTPECGPNIYADEEVLLEIACQGCGMRFLVEESCVVVDARMIGGTSLREQLERWLAIVPAERVERRFPFHWGDPPNADCCAAGPTMNCDDIRVVEFWERVDFGWVRVPELEVSVEDGETP